MNDLNLTNLLPQLGLAAYLVIRFETRMNALEAKVQELVTDIIRLSLTVNRNSKEVPHG